MGTSFELFAKFPELHVGLFGKDAKCTSDEECAAKLGFESVHKLHQIHGKVIHIAGEVDGVPEGDGLITDKANTALSTRWADCQGFVIYAPEKNVLAVLHAGWRGMAAKAITALYDKLKESFGVEPSETFVGITPSLCVDCAEFWNPTHELPEHMHPFIDGRQVNLQAAADAELESLGVPKEQRERHPVCTKCGEGYWSYRGDKEENARNYLVAGLKSN